MRFLFVTAVVVGIYFLFFAEEDRWSGHVYPDANDLLVDRPIGEYPTFEECQAAAIGAIRINGWQNADYECGLNCEPQGLINICEETRQ